ncbi:hypothetical protein LSAT2_023395 [Lamellibrachia satsuma]|nr:hypothetical protein LSAT2_023395 [Lamellibrachia satsuma]
MTTKTLCLVGLLLYLSSDLGCVRGQPTTDQCNRDTNVGLQEALLEQTFHTLQSMASRLESLEKRQSSMEQWMKENDKDTRCKWSVDGNRTCYKLVLQKMTWSDGRVYCQSLGEGADLVSIESQEENEFLIAMIRGVSVPGPREGRTLAACGLGWRRDNHSATHTGCVESRTITVASKKHAAFGIEIGI